MNNFGIYHQNNGNVRRSRVNNQDIMDRQEAFEIFVKWLAPKRNQSVKQVADYFVTTKTYELLMNTKSSLWEEGQNYILDMLEMEERGDMAGWLRSE